MTCGDVMKLQIKVNDDGIIEDVQNLKLMDVVLYQYHHQVY